MAFVERTRRSFSLALMGLGLAPAAALATELFVATTTFEISGSTSRMSTEAPYAVVLDEFTIHSDAVVRASGGHVFVLNRLFADNLLVLDALNDFSVVAQYSITGIGANPRDLERVEAGRAYLSLYETNALWVINPLTGAPQTSIDLSAFADSDGLAEIDQMAQLGGRLFVALQNLDRPGGWVPSGESRIVVVDTSLDQIVDADPSTAEPDAIELELQNPFWDLRYDPILQRIVAICSGRFLQADGGLEIVNPFSLKSEGALVLESTLGGDLLDFQILSPTRGYALIGKPNFDTCLVSFDPSDGSLLEEEYCSQGFQLQDLELTADGDLLVGDRSASAPGVRIFDASTGDPVAGPIDVGLPPFDMVLVETMATPAPQSPLMTQASMVAWPNPFNPTVQLRVEPWPGSRAPATVEIVDLRGRRVATRTGTRSDGGVTYRWDGREDGGKLAPSGTYFARLRQQPGIACKLLLVR